MCIKIQVYFSDKVYIHIFIYISTHIHVQIFGYVYLVNAHACM